MLFAIFAAVAATSSAQMPSIPGMGAMGGLPNISGMGLGNVAGVLSYCTKDKVLGGSTGASSVLGALEKKPGVTSSKEFSAGQAGQILTSSGSNVALSSVSAPVKSQACSMVLKQAKHFL